MTNIVVRFTVGMLTDKPLLCKKNKTKQAKKTTRHILTLNILCLLKYCNIA